MNLDIDPIILSNTDSKKEDRSWSIFSQSLHSDSLSHPLIQQQLQKPQPSFRKAVQLSPFFAQNIARNLDLLTVLFCDKKIKETYTTQQYIDQWYQQNNQDSNHHNPLECSDHSINPSDYFFEKLRAFKRYHLLRLIWKEITDPCYKNHKMLEVSNLADALLKISLQYYFANQTITDQDIAPFTIIILGKLGSQELNISSDIDLIFIHHDTEIPAPHPIYTPLAQEYISELHKITEEGQLFRIDMKLRPFGSHGYIIISDQELKQYMIKQARIWERFAYTKARILNETCPQSLDIYRLIQDFVYRPELDFTVITSLRSIQQKRKKKQTKKKHILIDIKHAPGGIRDIEFYVQTKLLIYGGKFPFLQTYSILTALHRLQQADIIKPWIACRLTHHYLFLRKLEHLIQSSHNRQEHQIKKDAHSITQLATALQWKPKQLIIRIQKILSYTSQKIQEIIPEKSNAIPQNYNPESDNLLQPYYKTINSLRNSASQRQKLAATIIKSYLQYLLHYIPEPLIPYGLKFLDATQHRTAYLQILVEYPHYIDKLIFWLQQNPFIEQLLLQYPLLIDCLVLRNHTTPQLLKPSILETQLYHQEVIHQLERLQEYKLIQLISSSTLNLQCDHQITQIQTHLSKLSHQIIQIILNLCWEELVEQYGFPIQENGDPASIVLLAYGTTGSLEMTFQSDIDLVFLHNGDSNQVTQSNQQTQNSHKAINSFLFFTRLAQKIIHYMTMQNYLGKIYSIDLKLRPSGQSGLLVSHIKQFASYQQKDARTWEHMALLRTTPVATAGTSHVELIQTITNIKHLVLTSARDYQKVTEDILKLQEKTIKEKQSIQDFDTRVKYHRGGMIHLHFLVHTLVILYAHQYPELTTHPSTNQCIQALQKVGILTTPESQQLQENFYELTRTKMTYEIYHYPTSTPINTEEISIKLANIQLQIDHLWSAIITERRMPIDKTKTSTLKTITD